MQVSWLSFWSGKSIASREAETYFNANQQRGGRSRVFIPQNRSYWTVDFLQRFLQLATIKSKENISLDPLLYFFFFRNSTYPLMSNKRHVKTLPTQLCSKKYRAVKSRAKLSMVVVLKIFKSPFI